MQQKSIKENFGWSIISVLHSVLQYLYDNTWLDVYTRAILVEFTVYNANVNLFCIATLMLESTAVGMAAILLNTII